MDSTDNDGQNNRVGKKNMILCMGNLHPKVSYRIIAKLYQVIRMTI